MWLPEASAGVWCVPLTETSKEELMQMCLTIPSNEKVQLCHLCLLAHTIGKECFILWCKTFSFKLQFCAALLISTSEGHSLPSFFLTWHRPTDVIVPFSKYSYQVRWNDKYIWLQVVFAVIWFQWESAWVSKDWYSFQHPEKNAFFMLCRQGIEAYIISDAHYQAVYLWLSWEKGLLIKLSGKI